MFIPTGTFCTICNIILQLMGQPDCILYHFLKPGTAATASYWIRFLCLPSESLMVPGIALVVQKMFHLTVHPIPTIGKSTALKDTFVLVTTFFVVMS